MSPTALDELHRRMGEVVVLPQDDPDRVQVVREVAVAGNEAIQLWLGLVWEDETMRLALSQVRPRSGLEERLLKIPEPKETRRGMPRRYVAWAVGVAATVLLTLVVAGLVTRWRVNDRLQTLSLLALSDHMNQPALLIQSSDPERVERMLKGRVSFPVEVYKPPAGVNLVGGGTCFVGGQRAAFLRFEKDEQPLTLFLVSSESVKLPRSFSKAVQTPSAPWVGTQHYRVAIWPDAEAACTWILVIEGDELQDPFVFARLWGDA